MRRYTDPVEVRSTSPEGTGAPSAFLWRGQLYVVREVLGHWHERQPWWTSPAARGVHGETASGEVLPGDPDDLGAAAGDEDTSGAGGDQGGDPGPAPPGARVGDLAREREVWRVSASPGRAHPGGVYDLCREPAGEPASGHRPGQGPPGGVWRLVRVAD
jgi:hypothetical protein